ncbi:alpha-mannosidase [Allokutzneria albata]|uniref:Alpha-mannosidase n=1 Tax=Allokutzneria albata TaxID=211114 RepID=A0A1G9RT48_ALLAB|nr:alpha-mannosidase [Allokutzneria albata]SDM26406.1 alpha-mannosidase [Allokutzneria albata]
MDQRVLHMIGNSHIDPVWLWQWPEGYQEVRATFQSAVDRMTEYPEFVFTMDGVVYLAWVEESDPELFERISERIAEGRWQVAGGWWVEPDCNLPGGESFARHGLYSQRYLREKFGVMATTGCNVDPFGHNASIPQILRKSGMDSYIFMRPGPHEMTLPGPYFWWESADGSRVLTYRIPHEYCSSSQDLGYQVDKSLAQLPPDLPELMVFYGVGNHGGGPTKANLDSIRRLDAVDGLPSMKCSWPRTYFDGLVERGEDIPVHTGELQHHAVGCYSAHSGVKRWNRQSENLLARAEKWSAIASVVAGIPYPLADFDAAWKLVLFNQSHDTLGGCSIEPAYEDSRDQYGHAKSLANNAFNHAVQSLSRRIDIPAEPEMTPLVVFNPHPWPLRTGVEFEFGGFPAFDAKAVDDDGEPVAVQRIRSSATVQGWRRKLVLDADVPPMGYRTYRIYPAKETPASTLVRAEDSVLENEFLAVEFDRATGWLTSLRDKVSDVELINGNSTGHAVVIEDLSDTWGHRVRSYDKVAGEFAVDSVRLVENGPVRAIVRVRSTYNNSTLVEEFVLGAHERHVEVRVTLDWQEKQRMLKLRFPTALSEAKATFEIPYGHIERPTDGSEEAAQSWVDVSGTLPGGRTAGLSVLNDGKYGHDVRDSDIGITVARSPVYAWHEPKELEPEEFYSYLDQGIQQFTYRLVPHAGDWRKAETVRSAAELNQRAFTLLESYHEGDLPQRQSFLAVDNEAVLLTVLKGAQDDDGDLVVRAYETTRQEVEATIELPLLNRMVHGRFGPSEIKTFRVPRDPEQPIVETDLLEYPVPATEPHAPEQPPHATHAGVVESASGPQP